MYSVRSLSSFFFFNDTATTEIYTLSLHDALPICLYTLGFAREANDFFYFIADVAAGQQDLQIMYGIGGVRELAERTIDNLSRDDSSKPVRVGNSPHPQKQHDGGASGLGAVCLPTQSRAYRPAASF